ncbi:MAG: aldo/keto reductase [Calditrichaeota bacterium]|nr:MAG: aldo/keto reductase [Calditrichota bacterium]MBL1204622.1 aldo/keto reductase [Calditrichota bacterium]NOG44451.1 aldo/keto reductase [Calditrichota bacterium]
MKYKNLGKNGPEVSTMGFGAWAIGGMNWGKTDDTVSINALNEAIDKRVTLIDTADVYGFGHSEELIAKVISERGKKNIIIATKAGNDFYNASSDDDEGYGAIKQTYTKNYLISAAEKSLKRLNLETLDILQLHSPDLKKLERDEPWQALEQLKKDGKIKHAGLSIQSFKETEQAHLLDAHNDILDCLQVRYNLLEREAEKVLFPKALKYGIGVIVRIPLLFGFLTGKFDAKSTFGEDDHRSMNLSAEKLRQYLNELERLEPLYDHFKEQSKAQVSLRFCISHPACQTAIPGAKTSRQVEENSSASDLGPIPQNILDSLV